MKIIGKTFVSKSIPAFRGRHKGLELILTGEIQVTKKSGWKNESYYEVEAYGTGEKRVISRYILKKYFEPC